MNQKLRFTQAGILNKPGFSLHTRFEEIQNSERECVHAGYMLFTANQWHNIPVYRRENLQPEDSIHGPAIIVEKISTVVVEPEWEPRLNECNHLILQRI
ncbi:hypothetical protein DP117_00175 [Brasilonema sp. UFV-L1]|nr:hypothetical protein [Brasilonema sp. UFV-L1]